MEFNFDRSSVVFTVVESADVSDFYLFHAIAFGPVWVPKANLRIEHHPEVGQHTGKVLLDFEGHGREMQAVLTTARKGQLEEFFAENNLLFPGLSPNPTPTAK